MHPNERRLVGVDRSLYESQMVLLIHGGPVEEHLEFAEVGRHLDLLLSVDKFLALAAIGDEILDRADLELMDFAKLEEVRQAGHGAVLVENLADDSGGIETGKTSQINARLRMARTAQDTSLGSLQGEDVARLTQIAWR